MKVFILAIISFLIGTVAVAAPLDKDNEFSGAISFGMVNGTNNGNLSGDLSLSRYIGLFDESTILTQLGLRQGVLYNFIDGARDQWLLDTSAFANLNYIESPDTRIVPYIGTGIGISYNDVYSSGILSPEAGVKLFLDDAGQTFVGLSYRYMWNFSDTDIGDGAHNAFLRVGYIWGGERPTVTGLAEELALASECCDTNARCCEKAAVLERKFKDNLQKH